MRWIGLLLAGVVGCADGADPAPGPCEAETRDEPVEAGTVVTSDDGGLSVRLVDTSETPPIVGENEWLLEVMDAALDPLAACDLTVTPWMPDHNHGSTQVPVVTEEGSGRYRVVFEPIMGGYWEIGVAVECDGTPYGEAVFKVCVET